jgi:hypothetical protein
MENTAAPAAAARRVAAIVDTEGVSIERVSQATDIPVPVLHDRLHGVGEFTLDELTDVGGLFRVSPAQFMEDA